MMSLSLSYKSYRDHHTLVRFPWPFAAFYAITLLTGRTGKPIEVLMRAKHQGTQQQEALAQRRRRRRRSLPTQALREESEYKQGCDL